jgi:hypothetical protein
VELRKKKSNPLLNTPLPQDGQPGWGTLYNTAIINLRTFVNSIGNNPGAHQHAIAEIIGLLSALNGKANLSHEHFMNELPELKDIIPVILSKIETLETMMSAMDPLMPGTTVGVNVSSSNTHVMASVMVNPLNVWINKVEYRIRRNGNIVHTAEFPGLVSIIVPATSLGFTGGNMLNLQVQCTVFTPKTSRVSGWVNHTFVPPPISEPWEPGGGGGGSISTITPQMVVEALINDPDAMNAVVNRLIVSRTFTIGVSDAMRQT